ncbi:7212_t:CDS:2, partial [Dentiscutata heterogama]
MTVRHYGNMALQHGITAMIWVTGKENLTAHTSVAVKDAYQIVTADNRKIKQETPVKRVTERLCMVSIPNILQINVDDSDGPEIHNGHDESLNIRRMKMMNLY